ncbi:MAG: GIY-YIG nuclease family protein [Gemmatimonadales bacterium]|nr:GIY-YIG nuclease family protein [Gemmatimonadales bacterium]
MPHGRFAVYILASHSGRLYVGVTNDLERRVLKHQLGVGAQFTRHYKVTKLVHYEQTSDVRSAIAREKQLKGWSRRKKVDLIETNNPGWRDLTIDWFAQRND